MRYYLPLEDRVSAEPTDMAIPLYEDRTFGENRSLVPGSLLQHSWDSVSLGLFKQCPHKYYLTILEGWHLDPMPVALQFGINFHSCMETRLRLLASGLSHHETQLRVVRLALLLGEYLQGNRTERTKETLTRAVSWYCDQFADDNCEVTLRENGQPTVEYSFCIPLADHEGLFQIDGQQIYLAGHLDAYVKFLGEYYVMDYKTTKGALDQNFFDDFENSYQQKGYTAAAHALSAVPTSAIPAAPAGVIIDGIQLGVNYNRFSRQIINWSSLQLEDYLTDLKALIQSAALFAEKKRWPHNETQCVGRYGRCPFFDVCSATPPKRERMLQAGFKRQTWDCRKER